MDESLLAVLLTILTCLITMGPLIYVSHPEWFRRPRVAAGQIDLEDDFESVGEYFIPGESSPESYRPIEVQFPPRPPVFTGRKAGENFTGLQSVEQVEGQPAEDFTEPLAFPNHPVVPVKDAAFLSPRRRRDYQFCIGSRNGENVFFPLGHMFVARRTGSGKSNLVGIIIGQALEQRIAVWYMSVAYAPVDEDGLDISPLIDRCTRIAIDPDSKGLDGLQMLRDACDLIDERKRQALHEKVAYFTPVLIVGEELKALQSALNLLVKLKVPGHENALDESSGRMEYILSTGRKYNVNYLAISQDGQSQTVKLSQGTLTNVEIRIMHPSLDPASRRNLLPQGYDLKHKPLPVPQNPYQWYLVKDFGTGMSEIALIDVPLLNNATIQRYIAGVPLVKHEPPPDLPKPGPVSLRDAGMGVVAPQPVSPGRAFVPKPIIQWTEHHVRAAKWLTEQQAAGGKITKRGLAEVLFDGKSDGRYNRRAGEILLQVCSICNVDIGTELEQDENPEL